MDKEILDTFKALGEEVFILFNKIDKLKQKDFVKNFREVQKVVGDDVKIIKFSAIKKRGVKEF
jgi:GTP-binding protein EngB required for normal cell division